MEKRKDSPRSEKWFVCSGHRWVTKGNGAGGSCLTEPAPRRGGRDQTLNTHTIISVTSNGTVCY